MNPLSVELGTLPNYAIKISRTRIAIAFWIVCNTKERAKIADYAIEWLRESYFANPIAKLAPI